MCVYFLYFTKKAKLIFFIVKHKTNELNLKLKMQMKRK